MKRTEEEKKRLKEQAKSALKRDFIPGKKEDKSSTKKFGRNRFGK